MPDHPGPLAGILAALRWASSEGMGANCVATVSSDAPFIPADLVARLSDAANVDGIAVARSGGRVHPLAALWPVGISDELERALAGGLDRALAVERVAERVDDAAEEAVADGHRHHLAGAADGLALLDVLPLAEEGAADVVLLEVERDPGHAVLELEALEGDAVLEAVDASDAVADLEHGADLAEVGLDVELADPVLQDRGDLFGA